MHRTHAMLGSTTAADGLAALGLLASPWTLVRGDAIERYERAFAARLGARHAISCSAARIGLYGLLGCLDVGAGDEVMLQVPTHAVVVNAIRYRGATPVFVDCEPRTANIDLDAAERLLTPRTRVLLLQHTFGVPADLDRARALAERHDLVVLEDAVHSLGSRFRGVPIGRFGRAAFFSTEESKTMSTSMGGMVVTDDDELADDLRRAQAEWPWPSGREVARYLVKYVAYGVLLEPRVHHVSRLVYERSGGRHPFVRPSSAVERRGDRPKDYERRLANAQARLGLRALAHLDANVAHRRRIAAIYAARLPHGGGLGAGDERMEASHVRFPVVVRDRQEALDALAPHVRGDVWFDQTVQAATDVERFGYVPGSCPVAEHLAAHLVNLPTHPHVRDVDATLLAEVLAPHVVTADG
ncbi:MAG TPA: DegT/DnrJ/EryC1/StrS aminotransferase family protein [Acidimicrobiales bacterium]|nr:DegT/DnrJ/EryC1/StrS aminotransferase family protein [Acidimicrobiales bacterium]